jgi:hypothetical protein
VKPGFGWLLFLMAASAAWGFLLALTIFEIGG